MKTAIAIFAATAVMGFSAAAAEGDYVLVLNEPAVITDSGFTRLSDRVYIAPSYMDAISAVSAENISSIFMDKALDIPSAEFEQDEETAFLYEETPLYPYGANDSNYYRQWYLSYINAQSAWVNGLTGEGVKIAVVDTGVNPLHLDIMPQIKNTFNCLSSKDITNVNDTFGHGTMVAGIIGATANNNKCISGITDSAELSIIKIIENDNSKPSVSTLLAGITKAVDYGCDVINMSLGWTTTNESDDTFIAVKQEIANGIKKGIIFVASAGNMAEGSEEVPKYYPAAFDDVISVASLGREKTDEDEGKPTATYNNTTIVTDEPSTFSVYNDKVTCAAPGYRIMSTFISAKKSDGTYTDPTTAMATSDGTSYAAPMVAAAAVIAKQLDPTINYSRFLEYLKLSVRDIYTEGYDIYTGYGALDIEKLIEVIKEDVYKPTPSPLPVSGFEAEVTKSDNKYTVISSFDDAAESFKIIAAAYNDGRLVSAVSQMMGADSIGTSFRFSCEEEIDSVSVMAWSPDGVYPLTECKTFSFATIEATPEPTDLPVETTQPPAEEINE